MKTAVLKYLGKNARNATGRTWLPVALCTVLIGSAWLAEWSNFFQLLENRTYDWRTRVALRFPTKVSDKIVLVILGEDFQWKTAGKSRLLSILSEQHQVSAIASMRSTNVIDNSTVKPNTPSTSGLPRAFHGELVRKLREQGAAAIGFDILFSDAGPEYIGIRRDVPVEVSNSYFASQLAMASNVVLASELLPSGSVLLPYDSFLTNAWETGFSSSELDSDGRLRRFHPRMNPNWPGKGGFLLANIDIVLAAKALRLDLKKAKTVSLPNWKLNPGPSDRELLIQRLPGTSFYRMPSYRIPLMDGGTLITWSIQPGDSRVPKVAFGDVLNGTARIDFRGKIVLVAFESESLKGFLPTPLSTRTPPTIVHANILNTFLTQQFIQKTSVLSNYFIISFLGMAVMFLSLRFRGMASVAGAGTLIAAYVAVCVWLFLHFQIWIPIAESVFAMVGVSYVMLLLPPKDRHKLAQEMFRKAGFTVAPAGPGIWSLGKDEKFLAAACLWNGKEREVSPTLVRLFASGNSRETISRIYVLFETGAPPIEMLRAWKQELGCEAVPILLSIVEKARTSEDCGRLLREIEEPYLVRSDPYAEFKPILDPTWFYGREELLRTLPAALAQGQHVGLFGLRKIGKTSLTNQLRQRSVAIPSAFLDCQGMNPKALAYFQEIYLQVHAELRGLKVPGIETVREIEDGDAFSKQIHELFKLWEQSGHREPFLVIFDEIDRFFPAPELAHRDDILAQYVQVFGVLRSLSQRHSCLRRWSWPIGRRPIGRICCRRKLERTQCSGRFRRFMWAI